MLLIEQIAPNLGGPDVFIKVRLSGQGGSGLTSGTVLVPCWFHV